MRCSFAFVLFCLFGFCLGANERVRIRLDDDWRFVREVQTTVVSPNGPFHWVWMKANVDRLDIDSLPAEVQTGQPSRARVGTDVFHGRVGFAWFITEMGHDAKNSGRPLHFESVDDNAAVFLNGKRLAIHEGWDDPFDVDISSAWNPDGPNQLVVLVQNTAGEGGIMGPVDFKEPEDTRIPPESAPGFDDHGWRVVHLPHDFVVEGTFDPRGDAGHGSLPVGEAWYRKSFAIPASYKGREAWIDFDGVYRNSTVWLNGHKLGNHPGGYDSFRYDIAKWANFGGSNELAVHVDARQSEGWWYEGGGIYRHVWLNFASPVHVRPWGTFVTANVLRPQGAPRGAFGPAAPADLTIQTDLDNASTVGEQVKVASTVVDPQGGVVATVSSSVHAAQGSGGHVVQTVHLDRAQLWSIRTPRLYTLRTTVLLDNRPIDRVDTPFGVRSIRFDPNEGFFLNGEPVKLQGTCNHQDHAGVGIAIPDGLFRWRVARLKDMGSNAYRCSHNPVAAELLDAFDRQGMLVMDETRHLGDTERPKSSESTPYSDLSELKSMVLRDRNHPSVIMWSMCNEEGIQGTEAGTRIFTAMMKLTKSLDPTRPVTSAMNFAWGTGISNVQDLQGFNYGNGGDYDRFHRSFPDKPVFGSETASSVSTRGIYANDRVRGYVSSYGDDHPGWGGSPEGCWKPIAERPWFEGGFVWTGFDYKGEPTPYGWPCINSHFGILDICGFPKDFFYYYQAWWGDKPVVHILPHWNWHGKDGQPIKVVCQSNADKVELFLNGKSLGVKDVPRYGHVEWTVNYEPGQILAKGYRDGKAIVTDSVATTGAPAALRLVTDRRTVIADGEDVSEVEVEVLDSAGRVVPDASDLVTFSVAGPAQIVGVGNGDPSSHEPDKATQRRAFNGLCMALVGAARSGGRIELTASAPNLKPAQITLTATKSSDH
jgi:beta-galactosidase